MSDKFEKESDRIQLAKYCEKNFRQNSSFPKEFIAASYEDLVYFLQHQGANVEDIFLEIFLEEMPDPLESK